MNPQDAEFSDIDNINIKCCIKCKWYNEDYPNSEDGCCMFNPPIAILMKDYEGHEKVRTVHPSPKYPSVDFCSKFELKEVKNDSSIRHEYDSPQP